MEINEGVISDINANDLPVTKEVSINATLSPDDDFDLNSPIVVKVSTNTSNKGEGKTKETKLTLDSITPENLFDIQIKEIDANLARYDEDLIIKGNLVRVINGMSNLEDPNLILPIKSKGTHKSAGNQGKKNLDVAAASIHTQSSTNPNPKCSKKSRMWTKQVRKPTQGKWSRLLQAHDSPPSQQGGKEDNGLGKRAMNDNRILPELPKKRWQVSKEDVTQSQILAKAVPQPCQKQ